MNKIISYLLETKVTEIPTGTEYHTEISREMSGSHGGEYEDDKGLGYSTV
jgi:hypothetical protein